ncbi:hypothetical protein C8R46DRAFT_369334 [Mycena filopes]|nr:hypothetical protein C8R46DRAFT_369334 [Mycena filopes]
MRPRPRCCTLYRQGSDEREADALQVLDPGPGRAKSRRALAMRLLPTRVLRWAEYFEIKKLDSLHAYPARVERARLRRVKVWTNERQMRSRCLIPRLRSSACKPRMCARNTPPAYSRSLLSIYNSVARVEHFSNGLLFVASKFGRARGRHASVTAGPIRNPTSARNDSGSAAGLHTPSPSRTGSSASRQGLDEREADALQCTQTKIVRNPQAILLIGVHSSAINI